MNSTRPGPSRKSAACSVRAWGLVLAAFLSGAWASSAAAQTIDATTYPFTSGSGAALEDMSGGTTQLLGPDLDDAASAVVPTGFEFWFAGIRYTGFSVSSNGLFKPGSTASVTATNNIASLITAPQIAPYWDNLWIGSNGKVHYKVVGAAPSRKLVVEWLDMQVPRLGAATPGSATFQCWIHETTGQIEFVYGGGLVTNTTQGGASIGLGSTTGAFASVTASGPTVSYATANNANVTPITSGTRFTFTPQAPLAPTNLSFTQVGAQTMTLGWTDNASNEVGYAVWRSTDGTNFDFVTQTAANTTSFLQNDLSPSTTYYWIVRAVTEGAVSAALTGSQATAATGTIVTAGSGNWSSTVPGAPWPGGIMPTASEAVTIANGHTITVDAAASCYALTVGQGSSGVLQFEPATARTLTVVGGVAVSPGAVLQGPTSGTQTGHVLSLGGSLTNLGTLDLSTNGDQAGVALTFTGNTDASMAGGGAITDVRAVTVNKGSTATLALNAPSFTVRGQTADTLGFLTLTSGTFRISGSFAMTSRVFTTAAYTLPAGTTFWLDDPNFTVAPQAGSPTVRGLRVSAGSFQVGTLADHSLQLATGAQVTVEGGEIKVAGRLALTSSGTPITYVQTGGTVTVNTAGSSSTTQASFDLGTATTSSTTISGGTIVIQKASTAGSGPRDYRNSVGIQSVTGGTLQLGNASTGGARTYFLSGTAPNLLVSNLSGGHTARLFASTTVVGSTQVATGATLDLNGSRFTQSAGNLVNDGTLTASAANSELYFLGSGSPQSYSGSGAVPAPVSILSVDNPAGVTLSAALAANIVTRQVNLIRGVLGNSQKLTLGNADATTAVTQLGGTGVAGAGGSYDASPVFNPGSGGVSVAYLQEGTPRATSFEIPGSRQLKDLTVNHPGGTVTVSGGEVSLARGLTLTGGVLKTTATDLVTLGDTVSAIPSGSPQSYVEGPLAITVKTIDPAAVNRTFAVGRDGAFRPLTLSGVLTGGAQQVITAEVLAGPTGGSPVAPLQSLGTTRYWRLGNSAGLNSQARVQLSFGADDQVGDLGNVRVAQSIAASGSYGDLGGSTTGNQSAGAVTSTADLAPGFDYFAIGSTSALAKVWDGGAGTSSWSDAANWSPDGVPDSTSDVTLALASPTTIHTSGDFAVRNLTVNANATLDLDSGTLTVKRDYSQAAGAVQVSAATLSVRRYTNLSGGTLDVGPGTFLAGDSVGVVGGTLSLSTGRVVADSTFAIEGGTVSQNAGVMELKGDFWRTSGNFFAGTGTTIFSGTTTQFIGGAVTYYNLVLRNGGAGNPKQLQSFLSHIVNNDLTVESTAQMDLSGTSATQLTLWGNLYYSGLTGGTSIGNLTIVLSGIGKIVSGVPAGSPALRSATAASPPSDLTDVPIVEASFRTDPERAQQLGQERDGKPLLALENTYEKRKAEVEQLLRTSDPGRRLVIDLDDMTLVRNPQTPAWSELAAAATTNDATATTTFPMPLTVNTGAAYALDGDLTMASSRTLTVSGRLDCGTSTIGGAGRLTVGLFGTLGTGTTSPNGLAATVLLTGIITYNDGAIVEYNAAGDQTIHAGNHPAAAMMRTGGGGTKTLNANKTLAATSGASLANGALYVGAGSTFADAGFRLSFTTTQIANVVVQGSYLSTGAGSLSFESGAFSSNIQAVNGTAFGDLLMNFASSTSTVDMNATGTVGVSFRNITFGGTAGTANNGGTLRLSETGTTNVTVTGKTSIAPRTTSATGGGFGGTSGKTSQVTLQGNLSSTSVAATQPIVNSTGTNKLVFAGSSRETLTVAVSATTFTGSTLKLANPAGLALAGSGLTYTIGAGGAIDLGDGNINTGTNTLALATGNPLVRTTGRVVGRLKKGLATGPANATFEIGTETQDTPVSLAFGSVSVAGNLSTTTTAGDHPSLGTSNLNAAKSVNRYYTVTNEGVSFDTCAVGLTFPAADVDAGADPSKFALRKFDSPSWSPTVVSARTPTSIQARRVTSFSDFAIGEGTSFYLTASAGANGAISPSGTAIVAPGGSQTYTLTPATFYHVADIVVDGASVGPAPSYTFSSVGADHTIAATFAIDTYTITASAGVNGAISPAGAVSVPHGSSQAFTITPSTGYHVADVVVDGSSVGAMTSYTFSNVTAPHTIAASFAINLYTITASAGANGAISPSGAVTVAHGSGQAFTITPSTGYHVMDVLVDGSSVGAVTSYAFSNVTAAHTIAASFAINMYTLTPAAGAHGSISPASPVVVAYGTNSAAFTMIPDSGYVVSDVQVDGVSVGAVTSYAFTNVTSDHSLTVAFTASGQVTFGSAGSTISTANACVTVPVNLVRTFSTAVRGYSVKFTLSPNLTLCSGPASISEGTYLNSGWSTSFHVTDNGGGTYTVDDAILSTACGPTGPTGLLFNVAVKSSAPNGSGTLTVNSVKLRACNNAPLFAIGPSSGSVAIDNTPPSVALLAPGSGSEVFVGGETTTITWTASDSAGVSGIDLAYSTDGGLTFPNTIATGLANAGSHSWLVPAVTTSAARVRATAHDGNGNTASAMSAASFVIRASNVPPAIAGVPDSTTIPELSAYTFTATATDADVPAQTLKLFVVGAPTGSVFDSTSGAFTWTPAEAQGPGVYPFEVRATDGIDTSKVAVKLTVTEVNTSPALAADPDSATIPELAPYTFTAAATDADLPAQPLRFSLAGAPAGAAIDSTSGVFTWTPTEAQGPGSYPFTVHVSDGFAQTSASITLTVSEVNVAPALSGVPSSATIPELSPYTFTASAADSDAPGQVLTFSLVGAPAGAAIDGSSGAFTWTPSEAQGPGSYPFAVRVSDGATHADASITLDVTEADQAPVLLDVPAAATIPELSPYTFTASATDADLPAQTITFSLVGAPSGATIGSTTGEFSWTPGEAQGPGSYLFAVRVSDGIEHADSSITLTVTEVNAAPALSGVPASATILDQTQYTFAATATDADLPAQTLVFSLVGAPAGAAIGAGTGVFTWTPAPEQAPGSYPFTVRVSDGVTETDASITLSVIHTNAAPVLSGVPSSATIPELSAYAFTATATDSDVPAQTLTFSLVGAPSGATIDGATGAFSWTPSETQGPGSYPFTVRVTDGVADADAGITLTVTEVNAAPALSSVPASATIPELAAYTFTATATDPDVPAQTLTFSLVGAPAGATIDGATGAFSWTPTEAQGPGSYPFTVRVTDGATNTDASVDLTVAEVNAAPVIAGVPASATFAELSAHAFTASATDADVPSQSLTFSLVGAPSGATIDPTTGAFSWTPTEAQGPGSYPFDVRVSDGVANTDASITLLVTEVDSAPVLSGVPASATIPELAAYAFTASATDADLPAQTLVFSLFGAPAGASINPSTGAFSWTPAEADGPGSYPFTVRVTDGTATTTAPITLTVTESNEPPVLSGVPASATIPEQAAYTFTASATDADVPAQTLTFSLVGAPAGATIDGTSGAFSWTPTETEGPGSYPFTVRVSDGTANTDAAISLTVTEVNAAPVVSGVPASATIPEQAAYTFTASATDADVPAQTLTFSLVGAPAGASIDPTTGAFSWTPTEAQGPDSYPFTVRVTDGVTNTDASVDLTVAEVNAAPVISGVPASPTIPEQAAYTFMASATDADVPAQTLAFSLVGAPSGATIDGTTGAFSWTPTEAQGPGSYPFTVRVSDGTANTDASITLTVTEVNAAPILSGVPASATIPEQAAYTFTASATDSDVPAQTLTFSLVGAPAGATIDGTTGAFSWTPSETEGPGSYPFTVRVSDGTANTDASITLTVTEVNAAPVLSGVPASATIPEQAAYTSTASATDSDVPAQTLTFSLVGAPSGATIDPTTGAFSWTPTEAQGPGSYPFTVRVSDGTANTDASITLTITEVNAAPVLSGVPASATIPEQAAYTFTAGTTDADVPAQTLAFSLVGAPGGATIDPTTGAFSWTPTEAQGPGSYPFTVRVSDGTANTDASITLTITEVNAAPVLSGVPASATIPPNVAYTFTATATDADLPAQTLTFSLSGAPAGAGIGASTGAFSWTPTSAQAPGTYPFSVLVTDGTATTSAPITLTVLQPVNALTDLAATQVKSGNDADGTTKIQLTWTPPPSGQTVEVFRAGFGGYPRYDDAGGQVPATPSYPPGAPWVLTSVTTSGGTDEPSTRDFYYYVAFVHGSGSIVSGVSNKTTGTLSYHLGDVSNGLVTGNGDNAVNNLDVSLLGAHYGISGAGTTPFAYLDVGPTSDHSTDGLPTTDGLIGFEDLILFALNYQTVSGPGGPGLAGAPTPPAHNSLAVEPSSRVALGDTIHCPLRLSDVGNIRGASIRLAWDPARVRPVGMRPGDLMQPPTGAVFSPRPGTIDAAFLGTGGLAFDGVLATVDFATLAPGDPGIHVDAVDARNAQNHAIELPVVLGAPVLVLPAVTSMALAAPNPFQQSTALAFDLARPERVELAIYSVDGRRVRTLADGVREAGQYRLEWDGRDARGNASAPGVYYARLLAGPKRFTRTVVLLQ